MEILGGYKGFDFLLIIFFFTIQIYCDFSGYSDIAIGTAKLLDIDLMTNFKSPYFSASIKEFWSRWHISLSTWFRDYVYIPLGGNQCSKPRYILNLLITFLVSGLWHGANWTFVIWGGIHGTAQVFENLFFKGLKKVQDNRFGHAACVLMVFIFCNFAWVFFRAETFTDAFYVISQAFCGMTNLGEYLHSNLMPAYQLVLLLFYIAILALYDLVDYKLDAMQWLARRPIIIQWIIYVILGLIIVFGSQKGVAAEFVYFQF